jgi:cell division protein FtsI/penicillin-binding protein 2
LDKGDLAAIIGDRPLDQPDPRFLAFNDAGGRRLYAETTLDPELQGKAGLWLKKTRARRAALVVMNPADGAILALAGYRSDGQRANVATTETFPAASLFKIVTAAAALEKADYAAESKVAFDGGKHTLYKANVVKKPDEGRRVTTLKEGFAESNNAVFGKVGAFDLGPRELADFAQRFYFNKPISFEAPVAISRFQANEEDDLYRLAELASGYNRLTKITPLHAALLAAAVINGGSLYEPTFAREVFDRENNIYYQSRPKSLGRVVSETTAEELAELMTAAVSLGTGRRHFADAENHPLLSGLAIGGKTGTMNDEEGTRVEWFVAYSYWPEPGSGPVWPLALAAVVAKDGRAAMDSQELIRQAMIAYYQPLLDGTGRVFR